MPSFYEIASELSRRWPELNRDGEANRTDMICAVVNQMLTAQTRCTFCGCLFNTGDDYGKEKLREHIQTCDKSPLVKTIIAAESLVVHMWVHSACKHNGYLQMTTEQKHMYCAAIGAKFDPLEPKFEEQASQPANLNSESCQCRACIRGRNETVGGFPKEITQMILCQKCETSGARTPTTIFSTARTAMNPDNPEAPMSETKSRDTMNGKPIFVVPSKAVFNFDSGFKHKLLCDGATFTAGNACAYSCSFCYVESMQLKQKAWFEKHGVQYPADTGHFGVVIRTKDAVERARIQLASYPEKWRKEKRVVYASPKVDVAANMDLVRETVEICKVILELTNWDIRLLSKSNLLPKVAQAILQEMALGNPRHVVNDRIIYGVSTGTLDDKLAAAFEEGTPKVSKRIESLHWLQDNGFRTFGMICPSLPQISEGYYKDFAAEMFLKLRAERLEHVWAEVINVRGESFERTSKCLREAGCNSIADDLGTVSSDKNAWENYARLTFEAHASMPYLPGQLRFLQYVNKHTRDWWKNRESLGAVLL